MERAAFALRHAAAMALADFHNQRVELIAMARSFQVRLGGEGGFAELLNVRISCSFRKQSMAGDDAAEVLIHHNGGMTQRIEQDGVRGFRANAGQSQQTFPRDPRSSPASVSREPP